MPKKDSHLNEKFLQPSTIESTQSITQPEEVTASFPVVGIGASAGGLVAFEEFFSGMPADSDPDMAFVLVQHLSPDHKSMLTELVKRYTRMEVFEVEDGIKVRPNCVYIIPPNHDMAFFDNRLQLLKQTSTRGQRLAIDFFFRSLAMDQHEQAICIILSGTGSDGTLGLRDIKGEGGLVIAQRPESAEYDAMPRNAIATGLVDFELLPQEMPARLISYVEYVKNISPDARLNSVQRDENILRKLFVLLQTHTGHDFSKYKVNTLLRRIERRMAIQQIKTLAEYCQYAQRYPVEVELLFRDLLIGVTNFFRDPEVFETIENEVIPKIASGTLTENTVRIWVPGCSTGEEAIR